MATVLANIPEELRTLHRWVCADESSKMPMKAYEDGQASVTNPNTWGTWRQVSEAVSGGTYPYAGFVFADDGYVGIDIDHAVDDDGFLTDEAVEAIRACGSYAELSKSGRGVHIICRGSLPFRGGNNRRGWEVYRDARYFVLTGRTLGYGDIVEAQEGIDSVLSSHFSDVWDGSADAPCRGSVMWKPEWEPATEGMVRVQPTWPEVASGARHLHMVSFCGQLFTWGAGREHVLSEALRVNRSSMKPPLPEEEVRQVVRSCERYGR